MKKFAIMMVLLASVLIAGAQEKLVSHKSFGAKAAYEVTLENDTVTFTPAYSLTIYSFEIDTSIVINLDTTKAVPGNTIIFDIITGTGTGTVVFGDGVSPEGDVGFELDEPGMRQLVTFFYLRNRFTLGGFLDF